MSLAVATRPARWPWTILAFAILAGAVGFVFVALNEHGILGNVSNFVAFMGMGVVGALILSRTPRQLIGLLLLVVSAVVATAFATSEAATYLFRAGDRSAAMWLAWPGNTLWAIGLFPLLVLMPLLFPDGRVASPRWRIVLWSGMALVAIAFVTMGFGVPTLEVDETATGRILTVPNPLHVPALAFLDALGGTLWIALLALFVTSVTSMVLRFRRSSGTERQQLKWFAFAVVVLVAYFIVGAALEAIGVSLGEIDSLISGLVFLGIPVSVGVAILQYRLWDLDLVVKKTVVAGTLVVLAIAAYAATVALIGSVVDADQPQIVFALALALGIAFRPVMHVARRVADRLVYGRRATPYEVLTEFSERLGTSYGTEDVLPRMAQVLADGAGAEVARVWLWSGRELRQAAVWPVDAGVEDPVATPEAEAWNSRGEWAVEVRDRGNLLGALSVRMPPAEPMNPAKEKLVRDLAAQAGLVLRNVRLVEDLRASRQRLVAAQDEERRRLERNIHDGAQQQLVALTVKARLARQLVERDPHRAVEVLGQIETETQDALEDLRDLARGIYPPLLADQGLVAAIKAQARKAAIDVSLDAEGVGRYPEDVEATVYFCTLEALQNVAKYAGDGGAAVRLMQSNGSLSFAVVDRGRGFDPSSVRSGSGLQGMADRLAAIGGSLEVTSAVGSGTTVAGRVPLPTA
jgi:signal transduction histidine kinase